MQHTYVTYIGKPDSRFVLVDVMEEQCPRTTNRGNRRYTETWWPSCCVCPGARGLLPPSVGLEKSAFAILWVLSDGRPRTLRQLTEELELEQSTVNRQVNAAIKHGYLERFEVEDSLSKLIRPTDAGREAFRRDGLLRAERLEQVFADLAPGSPEALLHELRASTTPMNGRRTGTAPAGVTARAIRDSREGWYDHWRRHIRGDRVGVGGWARLWPNPYARKGTR